MPASPEVTTDKPESRWRLSREVSTGLLLAFTVASLFPGSGVAAYVAVAVGIPWLLQSAWRSLQTLSIDVDFLMLTAAIGAVIVGEPRDAAILLFLFNLSSILEEKAMVRTQDAIRSLVKLRPAQAILDTPAGEKTVPIEQVQLGDVVVVPSFSILPLDGVVVSGTSAIDGSTLTGESAPIAVGPGASVFAATLNQDGAIKVRVTSTVGDSTLDKIIALVEEAQKNQASGERVSSWFGEKYTWAVLGVFAVSFVVRLFLGQALMPALYGAVVLLVALSPCALVISVPATTLSALAWAARNGILIRGGAFLELMGKVRTVAFDKTGTLTTGQPRLVEFVIDGQIVEAPWDHPAMAIVAGLEANAAHPVARSIMTGFGERRKAELADVRVIPGLGVSGTTQEGTLVSIGQPKLFPDLPATYSEWVELQRANGFAIAILRIGEEWAGLAFGDEVRPDAERAIAELRELGIKPLVMLTGDSQMAANRIGENLHLDDVCGDLLPEEKVEKVKSLASAKVMAMVGDGVNDGPALASANVGIAMGGLGSEVALNAADVVLMHDRLTGIPELVRLGRKTNRVIQTNLIFALGVVIALTVSSLVTTLPLPLAVVGHEGSTVLVILNGLRLLRGPSPRI